jgi:two-component system NtrC family sensor kinase
MPNRRILIVDDNQALHEDFKKTLSSDQQVSSEKLKNIETALFGEDSKNKSKAKFDMKFDLEFATQGEEALKKATAASAADKPFALIFMDVRMPPGWDGVTTIAKIWEKLPDTEMVICTAYSDYSLEDVISKLGVSERLLFLKKPFDSVEVQQMALALTTKWNLEQSIRKHTEDLEHLVIKKTKELELERAKGINNAKLAALGEMAGGIAHEINNPLAIIHSNITLQKELLAEKNIDMKMVMGIADKIELTTTRIAKVIKGLRTFSRSGDNDPFENTSIKQIILEALGICAEKFKINDVKLKFEESTIPPALLIDCRSTQIIQVLLNLLNNAYDAVQTYTEKWIQLEVKDVGSEVHISITDSGKGISQEVQSKMFHPFFTTKEIGKGTGLGLSISKGIIEDHKGTLKIDSQCANTRFIVALPKQQSASSRKKAV